MSVVNSTCLPGTLPGRKSYGANLASGHLSQHLAIVRECVINEQLAKARSSCCARPYVSPKTPPLPSGLLAEKCPTLASDPVQEGIRAARLYTVANPASVGSAPPSSVYMKRRMDMLVDPRLLTLEQQKQAQYNTVYPPRVIDTCPPPQVVAHAGEGIPQPLFKCALLNILVSN
jgi:hypothetical protein